MKKEEEEEKKDNWDLQEELSRGRNIFFVGVQLFEEKNLPLECLSAGGFKRHFLQRPVTLLTSATASQEAHKHKLTQW
jgi:hypothetical protein